MRAPGSQTTAASASTAAIVGYAAVGAVLCLNMLTSADALNGQFIHQCSAVRSIFLSALQRYGLGI